MLTIATSTAVRLHNDPVDYGKAEGNAHLQIFRFTRLNVIWRNRHFRA